LIAKRLFDALVSLAGLVVLAPVFFVIALLIRLDTPGPALYRQVRVGRYGQPFRIHKFRTMTAGADSARRLLTVGDDPRITRVGSTLRRYKLDELPQLLDVLAGTMSFVGPRPEVPHYVELYPDDVRQTVLSVRPGVTDYASIEYRNESEILAASADPERSYTDVVLPAKLRLNCEYVRRRTFATDLRIIVATLRVVFCDDRGARASLN